MILLNKFNCSSLVFTSKLLNSSLASSSILLLGTFLPQDKPYNNFLQNSKSHRTCGRRAVIRPSNVGLSILMRWLWRKLFGLNIEFNHPYSPVYPENSLRLLNRILIQRSE
uniref:Uncharacterized protein n=1 Tax=Cacopsylla melanoneura TaxID=428564 RepID=A0A8D8RXT1_9HEMI